MAYEQIKSSPNPKDNYLYPEIEDSNWIDFDSYGQINVKNVTIAAR